jgi:REP element-mobilizing transposase RayT
MAARRPKQLAFTYRTHGGARRGAGRPPKGPRAGTPHRARPAHRREHPVHVTLRARVRGLRAQRVFAGIREALGRANHRDRTWSALGVVDFSVQTDHVHMLVEASDTASLRRGMRGLVIRLARAINKVLQRKGPVWGDRWHGVALTSPRQVKRALAYVLMNHGKHIPASGHLAATPWIDPCSSALWFDGWRPGAELPGPAPPSPAPPSPAPPSPAPSPPLPSSPEGRPTIEPSTWLRRMGWRRHGLLSPRDAPRPSDGS